MYFPINRRFCPSTERQTNEERIESEWESESMRQKLKKWKKEEEENTLLL